MSSEERRARIIDGALDEVRDLDLAEQAERGGFAIRPARGGDLTLSIPSLGGEIEISMPGGGMALPELTDSLTLRVLALRYVKLASGIPASGEWIAYRDLPGGRFYAATIPPTVERPLAAIFGMRRGLLGEVAASLGGESAAYGDEAYVFRAFPRVPLLVVIHWGDDEFPPDCRVLFDRCCSGYLNTDDLKILATQLAAYLLKLAGEEAETENLLWMVQ